MFTFERLVRFEDVDAANIVFYGRFFNYTHDAMHELLGGLDGGYVKLVNVRRIGLPAVHVESDFRSPLRFGDVARIETCVARIGTKSVTFRHEIFLAQTPVATLVQTHAVTNLDTLRAIEIPPDLRALLEPHLG